MQTIQQAFQSNPITIFKGRSLVSRFFGWCNRHQEFRYGWLAAIVALHGCVLIPVTGMVIITTGNSLFCWAAAAGAMAVSLMTNLAALPTRITIPVFVLSVLTDLSVVIVSLAGSF